MAERKLATDEQARAYDLACWVIGRRIAECASLIGDEWDKTTHKQDENRIASLEAMQSQWHQKRMALDLYDLEGNKALVAAITGDVEYKTWLLMERLRNPSEGSIIDLANTPDDPDGIPDMGRALALGHIELMREQGKLIPASLLALEKRLRNGG